MRVDRRVPALRSTGALSVAKVTGGDVTRESESTGVGKAAVRGWGCAGGGRGTDGVFALSAFGARTRPEELD